MANKIKTIQRRYKNLKRRLPRLVGQEAVNFFKDNFKRQGFLDGGRVNRWKKRKYDAGRATLVKSGKLKRSIALKSARQNEVVITSSMPYSKIHNEGGTIRQTVTNKQRKFFWAKYKATDNEMYKRMALSKKLDIRISKRQFMGDSSDLDKQVLRMIRLNLLKITK